ncbi:hypothetical protein WN944_029455 [Citrus x changshan-huyou]|uniref:Uncharacterized protein n=1 Tax=Citrus x changshan-huyou TaxID=2935761 RepID=A0AAP0LMB7_9ROSI
MMHVDTDLDTQFNPSHQQISLLATTLDPKKHTVDFFATQNFPSGDIGEAVSGHSDRLGPDSKHLSDPPDAHNASRVNDRNAQAHPTMSMGENDGEEMSDEEDSMIEETPSVLMLDVNGQH